MSKRIEVSASFNLGMHGRATIKAPTGVSATQEQNALFRTEPAADTFDFGAPAAAAKRSAHGDAFLFTSPPDEGLAVADLVPEASDTALFECSHPDPPEPWIDPFDLCI